MDLINVSLLNSFVFSLLNLHAYDTIVLFVNAAGLGQLQFHYRLIETPRKCIEK